MLFQWVTSGRIKCLYSDVTEGELSQAPEKIRIFFKGLPAEFLEKVPLTIEAIELANQYVTENVVGKSSFDDCLHIAMATIQMADILASWNFKHIVNSVRIKGYNSVNLKYNYKELTIKSPKQIVEDESQS
jgi:hypothetical protein